MNNIINLPESATHEELSAFLCADEIAGPISETNGGAKHVSRAPGADIIGKRVVSFEKVRDCEPGAPVRQRMRAAFLGWKKVDLGYVVDGVGATYKAAWADGAERCNYYVREA